MSSPEFARGSAPPGRAAPHADVRRVPAEAVRPLRRRVLRPDRPAAESVYPEDDVAVHLAAYRSDVLVGCASVFAQPLGDDVSAWRLRGMATDPQVRGQGYGAALLSAAVEAARAAGAPVLWCNARAGAVGFYRRGGFVVVSEEFDLDGIGPHRRMVRELRGEDGSATGAGRPAPRGGSR